MLEFGDFYGRWRRLGRCPSSSSWLQLLYFPTQVEALSTDNLQEPRCAMERKFRGHLRLFRNSSDFLDNNQTSNLWPNFGEPTALTD